LIGGAVVGDTVVEGALVEDLVGDEALVGATVDGGTVAEVVGALVDADVVLDGVSSANRSTEGVVLPQAAATPKRIPTNPRNRTRTRSPAGGRVRRPARSRR